MTSVSIGFCLCLWTDALTTFHINIGHTFTCSTDNDNSTIKKKKKRTLMSLKMITLFIGRQDANCYCTLCASVVAE